MNLRLLLVGAVLLAVPATAAAEARGTACFRVEGEDGGERVQQLVGLTSVVRLSEACTYAQSPEGPWYRPSGLTGRDTDFLEVLHHVTSGGATPAARAATRSSTGTPPAEHGGDPRFLFARPASASGAAGGTDSALHTLILRYCVHYLLEEQLGFRVLPSDDGFQIERVTDGPSERCDSTNIELRAVENPGAAALLSTHRPGAAQSLGVGENRLALRHGEWTLYAARPGARVGLRVAVFRARSVVTPLQNHLRSVGLEAAADGERGPLFATRWNPDTEGLLLVPTEHAQGEHLLWPELRTAADAGYLWVARSSTPAGRPVVLDTVRLERGQPAAVRFPDGPVREYMESHYGPAGAALTPSMADWRQVFTGLALCLTPSYRAPDAGNLGNPVPEASSCANLSSLISFEDAGFGGGGGSAPRICIRRGMQIMSADDAHHELHGEQTCFELGGADEPTPLHIATVGDTLTVENGDGLCLLIDNESIHARDGEYHLERSGLLEIRQGGGAGCTSGQALSRLRLPVIDPEREWHPVGFHTDDEEGVCASDDDEGEPQGACPWRAMAHDEHDVFAYVRSRHSLEFRLSTSPTVAAAINRDGAGRVLVSQDVPLLSGVEGDFEGPRAPALVAFVSSDGTCPSGEGQSVAELRRQRPIEPDGQIVDRIFHVFLAAVGDADAPPQCLARATFRVRPSRALLNATAGRLLGVELGLLGDIRAVVFATSPAAMGLALPVFYFRLNLFPVRNYRFLGLEVAGNLVFAGAFDGGGISRTGGSLSAALQLGIPRYVPRLLSAGIMFHAAFDSHDSENPIFSVFVGLDLSTLVDLAGGR